MQCTYMQKQLISLSPAAFLINAISRKQHNLAFMNMHQYVTGKLKSIAEAITETTKTLHTKTLRCNEETILTTQYLEPAEHEIFRSTFMLQHNSYTTIIISRSTNIRSLCWFCSNWKNSSSPSTLSLSLSTPISCATNSSRPFTKSKYDPEY